MNLDAKQRDEITRKNGELEAIKPILKDEYRGIDNVIDDIIEAIRPFYIFPTSLKRPLVVNLWGLTGTGKTSVLNRIMELLNLRHKYCKFDVGEYAHASSEYKLKFDLSDKVEKCTDKHLILAFDEFQLGRTISENGTEIDRPSLRPIWDIIDSGIIHQFNRGANHCSEITHKLKKCLEMGVIVENGLVVKNEDIYNSIFRANYLRAADFKKHPSYEEYLAKKDIKSKDNDDDEDDIGDLEQEWYPPMSFQGADGWGNNDSTITGTERSFLYKTHYNNAQNRPMYSEPYFIKYEMFNHFFTANPIYFMELNDYERWKHKFREGQDGDALHRLVMTEFVQKTPMMQSEDYSQSLIFCIGNVDEAYNMTHSSNPDADADLFHENSLKITVPAMKEALATRFRMEQIGRLGNTHIIYPSLSKQTYVDIIERYLKQRIDDFEASFGIVLMPDDTVRDILYKEAVFPTQGARPILSTFNTLVDGYVAKLVSDIIFKNPETDKIEWTYHTGDDPYYIFKSISPEKTVDLKYPIKLTIEQLRKSDFSETQAYVAVHEAGHALAAILICKLIPQEVKSRTAMMAEGFCYTQWPDSSTKSFLKNRIAVLLGGLEAEKLIFGEDNMSNGGASDLMEATKLAAAMVKTYGMAEHMHQISVQGHNAQAIYDTYSNRDAEKIAIDIVKEQEVIIKQVLNDNIEFLLELAHHLTLFPIIGKEDLTVMAQKYTNDIKTKEKYYDFKNMIKNEMLARGMKYTDIPEELVKHRR